MGPLALLLLGLVGADYSHHEARPKEMTPITVLGLQNHWLVKVVHDRRTQGI